MSHFSIFFRIFLLFAAAAELNIIYIGQGDASVHIPHPNDKRQSKLMKLVPTELLCMDEQ
jgi:hypothetical protein